ncbi:MAG: alpha/beta hydrolase [Hyphomicrobiaceae bacterium]
MIEYLGDLPPAQAGDAAFRIFCTPSKTEWRGADHRKLSERARFHLRHAEWLRVPTSSGDLQAYRLEPDKQPAEGTVMLVHGWTSEAAFMTAMAEPIRRAGFRVVLFDLPAHGLSPGRRTNLVDCARATLVVAEALGPLHAIVAHSFGGMVSLLAAEGRPPMPRALDADHVVLIACPNRLADVTGEFAARRNMTDAARRAFEQRLERVGRRPIDRFATAELLLSSRCRAMVVHARDDIEVPFHCAQEVVAASPAARLAAFEGFGHRNILFAPPVVRAIVRYLVETKERT